MYFLNLPYAGVLKCNFVKMSAKKYATLKTIGLKPKRKSICSVCVLLGSALSSTQ